MTQPQYDRETRDLITAILKLCADQNQGGDREAALIQVTALALVISTESEDQAIEKAEQFYERLIPIIHATWKARDLDGVAH